MPESKGFTIKNRTKFVGTQAAVIAGKEAGLGFQDMGRDLQERLQSEAPSDTGKFKRSIKFKVRGRAFQKELTLFSDAQHAEVIEKGRRKNRKPPPPDPLERWARRKGFGSAKQIRGVGFLLSRKIAKEGLPRQTGFKPSHALFLFRDLPKRHRNVISRHLKRIELRITNSLNR